MYTGGSNEGPICAFTSDRIREVVKIKEEGGKKGAHSHDFLLVSSSFSRRSQERTLHIIRAAWGVTELPEPPFWKHPQKVPQTAMDGEMKRNADETA